MSHLLYRTTRGPILVSDGRSHALDVEWDDLLRREDLPEYADLLVAQSGSRGVDRPAEVEALAPIGQQEVWAAGVTYERSRTARMEEARQAGGSDFYDRVYHADRPELFLKATPSRVVGPGGVLQLRHDSSWIVPEPELTLLVSPGGRITGATIGNDLSCRDIEGENPLYLPQAKTFDACAALGPAILLSPNPPGADSGIRLTVRRGPETAFVGETSIGRIRKPLEVLVEYLYRATSFPNGCFLMTGTGIVPPDDFSLDEGDIVEISIDSIGTLRNLVARIPAPGRARR